MELKELMTERRSVRSYRPGTVDEALMREIVEAARLAPSWKNTETARSYVACSPETVAKIRSILPEYNAQNTANAAAYVVSTFVKDVAGFNDGVPTNELGNLVGAYDLGLYHCYMLLKARELGLDSLIMGMRDAEALRELLDIPENEQICMVLAFGYRSEKEVTFRPRKSVDEIARFV